MKNWYPGAERQVAWFEQTDMRRPRYNMLPFNSYSLHRTIFHQNVFIFLSFFSFFLNYPRRPRDYELLNGTERHNIVRCTHYTILISQICEIQNRKSYTSTLKIHVHMKYVFLMPHIRDILWYSNNKRNNSHTPTHNILIVHPEHAY